MGKTGGMKLVLHIGTPKTGSTLLQTTCLQNRTWLSRQGVYFPSLLSNGGNHLAVFAAATPRITVFHRELGVTSTEEQRDYQSRFLDRLDAEIERARATHERMLVTSENLAGGLRSPGIATLHGMLAERFSEIEILVYLRRQDNCLLSLYAEGVRRGFLSLSYEAFLEKALAGLEAGNFRFLDYQRLLKRWAGSFGRRSLDVRLFDPAQWVGGDLTGDFMTAVVGTAPEGIEALDRPADDYRSLSAPSLKLLRRVNRLLPYVIDGRINPRRARIQDLVRLLPREPKPEASLDLSNRIMTRFEASNEQVRRKYFPAHEQPLFPSKDRDTAGNMGRLGPGEATRAGFSFARAAWRSGR